MMTRISLGVSLALLLSFALPADAQFRRGLFSESTEVTLYPIVSPVLLLPAGTVAVDTRNSSTASARIVERLRELMKRQLADNDSRLRVADKEGDVIIVATLNEWAETRRSGTKYVSETRQIGTKQVTDKNGKTKTEPVYEYGHNEPSMTISGNAAIRIEVRPRSGGAALADETARHTIQEEHLVRDGPPSRDAVEDTLIDNVVRKAAGRVTPGREPIRALLARSDDVDKMNAYAKDRKWQDWLGVLEDVKPNRDRKKDSYRIHNLAVALEALAYESTDLKDSLARLAKAAGLIQQAQAQNKDEKYINESSLRIAKSSAAYQRLADLYEEIGSAPGATRGAPTTAPATTAAPERAPQPPTPASAPAAAAMTNKDVIDLRVAGLDDNNLIAAIKDAKAVSFDLSPAGLKALLQAKVSNVVISAMRSRTQ